MSERRTHAGGYAGVVINYDVTTCADANGFKSSKDKTCIVHFCNQRKSHPDPSLFLHNHPLPVVKEAKILVYILTIN